MLNQLKWDFIDLWKRVGWVVISIPLIIVLVLLPTNSGSTFNLVLISSVTMLCMIEIAYLIILGNLISLQWLFGRQTQLHFSVAAASWKMFLSKILLAALLNIITCFIALQIMMIVSKYSVGTFRWITMNDLGGIPEVVLLMCLVNLTFIFSNLLARSISWARAQPSIFTFAFGFGILFVLVFLALFAIYPIWIGIVAAFFLAEFFGSTVLIHRYAHLD